MKIWFIIALIASIGIVCWGQGCGYPGSPANGGIDPEKDFYEFGETVAYYCDSHSILMGTSFRDCQIDGRWSEQVPVCSTPLQSLGPSLAAQNPQENPPELAVDGLKETCTKVTPRMSRWWRVDLDRIHLVQAVAVTMPDRIEDHKFTLYVITRNGSKTAYSRCASFQGQFASPTLLLSCAEGKGLKGQIVHIEDNRHKPQAFEICEIEIYVKKDKYKCGEPDRHPRSRVVKLPSNQVTYQCVSGFLLNGPSKRECLLSGQWSGRAPKCLETKCSSPPPIPYGKIDVFSMQGSTSGGNLVLYSCDIGYMLLGNSTRMCRPNGTWSGTVPTCRPVNCGEPDLDDDDDDVDYKLLNGTKTFGSVIQVYCESDNDVYSYITCMKDGQWSELNINCTIPDELVTETLKGLGAAVMPTDNDESPKLYFTEGILVALIFAGVVIILITVSLVLWQRSDNNDGE